MHGLSITARAVMLAVLGVALSACVTTVPRPEAPNGAKAQAGLTYGDGVDYVENARKNMEAKLAEIDNLEAVTKDGVGLGIAGAGTAAVFHAHEHPILTFLTLGALSYTVNQAVDPKTLAPIYNAGLDNLDCIDSAAAESNASFAGLGQKAIEIDRLVKQLRADIAAAVATGNTNYNAVLAEARLAADGGETVLAQIQAYQASNPVPGAMIRATTRTVHAVNQQLRERSPSIEAIAQSGGVFSTFLNSGVGLRADAEAAANKFKKVGAAHAGDALNDRLATNTTALKTALESVSALLAPVNVATITGCSAQFAALSPIVLLTPSPIDLDAGGKAWLQVPGDKPFYLVWAKPDDVLTDGELQGTWLRALPSAQTKTYKFRVRDQAGHVSTDEYVLNVKAKAAEAPAAAPDAEPAAVANKPAGQAKKKPAVPPSGH
jgi:hypothetical protein